MLRQEVTDAHGLGSFSRFLIQVAEAGVTAWRALAHARYTIGDEGNFFMADSAISLAREVYRRPACHLERLQPQHQRGNTRYDYRLREKSVASFGGKSLTKLHAVHAEED